MMVQISCRVCSLTSLSLPVRPPLGVDTHRHQKAAWFRASRCCWQLLIKAPEQIGVRTSTQMELDGRMPAHVIMQMFVYLSHR